MVFGFAAAAVVYCAVSLLLFGGLAMGECLPRSDPQIYLCDAAKRRDILIYLALFLANPAVTVLLARNKSAEFGLIYLAASSVMPFIVVLAVSMIAQRV